MPRHRECSHSLVWVEHDSNLGSNGSWWHVLGEVNSDLALVTVCLDDGSPHNSISSVVYGVLALENIGNSLTHVPSGTGDIVAVLDSDQSLVFSLSGFSSSESSKGCFLIKSHWLSFVIDLLLGSFDFLCHYFSFCNNDYSIYFEHAQTHK